MNQLTLEQYNARYCKCGGEIKRQHVRFDPDSFDLVDMCQKCEDYDYVEDIINEQNNGYTK